jgi:hypothetical protein
MTHPPHRFAQALSRSALRLFLSRRDSQDVVISSMTACGFLWRRDEDVFLITTRGVLTGVQHVANQLLAPDAFVPTAVDFAISLQRDVGAARPIRDTKAVRIKLLDDDGQPLWRAHPTWGKAVDVAALKLPSLGDSVLLTLPVNAYDDFTDFEPRDGDGALTLGYPRAVDGGDGNPAWAQGAITGQPVGDMILIETQARGDMAGSLVVATRDAAATFLGIYGGRGGEDAPGRGIVWRAAVIEQIIAGGV